MTGSHEVRGSNPLFSTIKNKAGSNASGLFCMLARSAAVAGTPAGQALGPETGESMSENVNPVETFGLHVAHVGINAASAEEARKVADLFSALLGIETVPTPVSAFSGTLVEVMSGCGRGEKGHIGFGVNDIKAAENWFVSRGFAFNESSRALNPDGSIKLIYFADDIAGFAIHLAQD